MLLLAAAALLVAEVALLGVVGRAIGVLPLVGLLAAEAALGGWLLKVEGAKAWRSLQEAQRDPERLGPTLSDAALVLVGAVLLALPGFLSDAVGLLFLVPGTRGLARRGLTGIFRALTRPYRDRADLLAARAQPGTVVEGEAVDEPTRRPPEGPGDTTILRGELEP